MSCITKSNVRCTKCCEAIHISKRQWLAFRKGTINIGKSASIATYWKPISHRRAKKINPYVFARGEAKPLSMGAMQFFKCTALVKGVGCSIREQDDHPEVCKVFMSDDSYSPTCAQDYNIIARSSV